MGQILLQQGLLFSQLMPKYLRWVLAPSLLTYSFFNLNNSKHAPLSYTRKVRCVFVVEKLENFCAFDWSKALVVSHCQVEAHISKAVSPDQRTFPRHYTHWILDRMIFMVGSCRWQRNKCWHQYQILSINLLRQSR